ncbi:MAG: hypothetical protein ACLSHX_17740 [Suilimivivens sp.]
MIAFEADSKICGRAAGAVMTEMGRILNFGGHPAEYRDAAEGKAAVLSGKKPCNPVYFKPGSEISGPALRKVDKNVYARILNDCLKVAKGGRTAPVFSWESISGAGR